MEFSPDALGLGEEGFVGSGEVTIHYVTRGAGPLVVLIHLVTRRMVS